MTVRQREPRRRDRDFMGEQWLPVPGYAGRYEVSDQGRVRSLERIEIDALGRRRPIAGRILIAVRLTGGYAAVKLPPPRNTVRIHTLVMEAFVGPRPPDMYVLHRNGDPMDPRLTNLRYGTPSENMEDARRHGRTNAGRKNYAAKLTDERVSAARVLANEVSHSRLARAFEVSVQSLQKCVGAGPRLAWSHVTDIPTREEAWMVLLRAERAKLIRVALPFMVAALELKRASART